MRFGSVSYLNAPAKVPRERLRRTFAGGLPPPQWGRAGAPEGGGHRISDITGGPRNPALTRVITGPNGPPDNCKLSIAEVTCPANYLPKLPAPKHSEASSSISLDEN